MRKILLSAILMPLLAVGAFAARQHVVRFGAPAKVKLFLGSNETKSIEILVRPLVVDGTIKEFTAGESHDVTDRTFVVQRAFRVNDALPEDGKLPRWRWQRGDWLLVNRSTGHITQLKLPEFDPFYSLASWYRDFVAYCGLSDNGEKLYAVVVQLGRKRPVLRKQLGIPSYADLPDANCTAPQWQRQPARVTFQPHNAAGMVFDVHGRALGAERPAQSVDGDEEEEE